MRHTTCVIALAILGAGVSAQDILPGKKGAELRKLLRENYTPNAPLNYNTARAIMFGTVDNNGGKVELAYTTEEFPIDPAHPIPDGSVVNTEHTWPQSMFGHVEGPGMKTDLHHLFPSRNKPNAVRGHKPFADIPDDVPHLWFNGPMPQSAKPASNIDAFSEATDAAFEPEEDHKGNVARAMVYFFTIYEDRPAVNKPFFLGQVVVFKKWHQADKADAKEKNRSERIELAQGNVNPFVFDPTLLDRALDDIAPAAGPAATDVADDAPPAAGTSPVPGVGTTDGLTGVGIVALLPNPVGPDEGNESVTLGNPAAAEVDLNGWKLADKAGREFKLSGKIGAGQTLAVKLVDTDMVLGNNGGEVSLFDAAGVKRQAVSYTRQQAKPGAFVVFGS